MKTGRGSVSGANAHGRWEMCEKCRLRILYVPAFGAHAHYRQAGPLPADTATAVKIAEERVKAGKEIVKEDLNAKNVSLQGAEDSLLRRLEQVRSQKEKENNKNAAPQPKSLEEGSWTRGETKDQDFPGSGIDTGLGVLIVGRGGEGHGGDAWPQAVSEEACKKGRMLSLRKSKK